MFVIPTVDTKIQNKDSGIILPEFRLKRIKGVLKVLAGFVQLVVNVVKDKNTKQQKHQRVQRSAVFPAGLNRTRQQTDQQHQQEQK